MRNPPAGSSQTLRAMRERIPSDVAICVGERHYTRFGIRSLLEKHVCDVIMPDITRCGGPSEMKQDGYDGGGLQRSDRPA